MFTKWETPGIDGGEYVITYYDINHKRRTIAHVYGEKEARLIAAAPEMYELLKHYQRILDYNEKLATLISKIESD